MFVFKETRSTNEHNKFERKKCTKSSIFAHRMTKNSEQKPKPSSEARLII